MLFLLINSDKIKYKHNFERLNAQKRIWSDRDDLILSRTTEPKHG